MLGSEAELQALLLYQKNGYLLIQQNYRVFGKGRGMKSELDIILTKKNILVCVEVKNRTTQFAPIEESITMKKIETMKYGMQYFILENQKYKNFLVRFDAVFVTQEKIEVIENIV